MEPIIDSYMATIDLETGYSGADKIIVNLLGLPESACVEATEKNWHIVIETVFWCANNDSANQNDTSNGMLSLLWVFLKIAVWKYWEI